MQTTNKPTPKGKLILEIGPLKPRLVKAAQGKPIKPLVLEILEEGLKKRGY